ncbi:MAG: FAD-binding oxidoreductase [Euzebyales bacterium]|nr:FAD-binding oxidoreductase [Euzebyales bacterium]
MAPREALVVGAGVSGLSVAVRLLEAGWDVRLWADKLPVDTTSGVAAAIWYPYRAYPEERVLAWGARSLAVFTELAHDPATGVDLREGLEVAREPLRDPWWAPAVPALRHARTEELPARYADGLVFRVPVVEMPVYLRWLEGRVSQLGGHIQQRRVRSLREPAEVAPVVVDCAGLGARELVPDPAVTPIRGQVVRVRNPGLTRFLLDESDPEGVTYVVPRRGDVVLGGTAQEGESELRPDPATATAILRRCTALEPRLAGAEILEHRVGLRPGRPAVRLEAEDLAGGTRVVHDYGHGGAGVTLSWGCAQAVVELLA